MTRRLPQLVALLVVVAATSLWWHATAHGLGLFPDTAAYVQAARNLATGHGLSVGDLQLHRRQSFVDFDTFAGGRELAPLTQWPPLLSVLLAVGIRAGIDPLTGARVLHFALYLAFALMVSASVRRAAKSDAAGLSSLILALFGAPFVWYVTLLSEPLYLFLSCAALVVLSRALDEDLRASRLVLCGALLALSQLARYVGIATVAGALGAILILGRVGAARRLASAALVGVVAYLPMMLWMLRNRAAHGAAIGRDFFFQPPDAAFWLQASRTTSEWLLVTRGPLELRVAVALAIAAFFVGAGATALRRRGRNHASLPGVFALWALSYAGLMVANRSLGSSSMPADARMLLPLYVCGVVLLGCMVPVVAQLPSSRARLRAVAATAVVVLSVATMARTAVWGHDRARDGFIYSSPRWRDSPAIAAVRAIPPGTTLYSNGPDVMYLLADREAFQLPALYRSDRPPDHPMRGNPNFSEGMRRMGSRLHAEAGFLVLFDNLRPYFPSAPVIGEHMQLRQILRTSNGTIYAVESGPETPRD